jgi:hypothetical protein
MDLASLAQISVVFSIRLFSGQIQHLIFQDGMERFEKNLRI